MFPTYFEHLSYIRNSRHWTYISKIESLSSLLSYTDFYIYVHLLFS